MVVLALSGCSSIPQLPSEDGLPVQRIVHNTICELKDSFEVLNDKNRYPNFKADERAMSISLTPKIDREFSTNFGFAGKGTADPKILHVISYTLGAPGAQFDEKGHSDANAEYPLHSSQLLDGKHPIDCSGNSYGPDALSQRLNIAGWLQRVVSPGKGPYDSLSLPDKAAFTAEIVIKYDITTAGLTYTVPTASYSPSLSASDTRDETLTIAFTPDPKKIKVSTLPENADLKETKTYRALPAVSPGAAATLNQIQTDVRISNINRAGNQ
jgi:hypothetical protein